MCLISFQISDACNFADMTFDELAKKLMEQIFWKIFKEWQKVTLSRLGALTKKMAQNYFCQFYVNLNETNRPHKMVKENMCFHRNHV